MNVTRDVVRDLWPCYASGRASAETCALVEEFLARDPAFAERLRGALPRRSQGLVRLLFFLAVLFTCFAFGRIVADTSWDISPARFVFTVVIAIQLWVLYFVTAWVVRRRARSLPS